MTPRVTLSEAKGLAPRVGRSESGGDLRDILARLDAAYDFPAWHWQRHTPPEYIAISAVLVQHRNIATALRSGSRGIPGV